MAETELERAEKRYAQAKARLQALKNREAAKQRKLDTRRKVILGGALIDLAGRDDAAALMLDRLIRNLPRDQDRKAFEGWSPERDAAGANEGDAEGSVSPAPAVGDADRAAGR
ncbi:MAG: mobilization protein [Paracoccus sp. (in: a-proteobacteria)]|uniref:mobilization protein n=1 Tax=Paracoccus sp. TaxID=267 RepID=UPI00405A3946